MTAHREGSFPEAVLAHLDGLYGFAMTLTRDPTEAEDLVQETYLRATQARRRPEAGTDAAGNTLPGNNLKPWLFTIMRNLWLNRVRRQRGGPELVGLDAEEHRLSDATTDPQIVHLNASLGEALRAAVERLPPHYREVVLMRDSEGLSYREIAGILGCPAGTVMSRLARARERLKHDLSDWHGEPEAGLEIRGDTPRASRYGSL
jgi:RNA polymerase sigma-70 factor (ECF subfamily)